MEGSDVEVSEVDGSTVRDVSGGQDHVVEEPDLLVTADVEHGVGAQLGVTGGGGARQSRLMTDSDSLWLSYQEAPDEVLSVSWELSGE